MITLHHGDCLEIMPSIPDNSIDAVICDPPYELGFMGKTWDNTGIAYNVNVWRECLRVLKPGGHLLAFGGTRTYHRMTCAIEDSGFEIRDMIEWVYGSGFPKSLNIGKAVDKLQGNEREVVEEYDRRSKYDMCKRREHTNRPEQFDIGKSTITKHTKGTSNYEGWGTALKPAHEPICMARKPISEKTVAENCLKWGTGGINIDESRVGTEENTGRPCGTKRDVYGDFDQVMTTESHNLGRFPANLIHDNSEEVRECFPETKGEEKRNQKKAINGKGKHETCYGDYGDTLHNTPSYPGSGNASRFFKSIIYTAKASKSERNEGNNHPTVKPIKLMEYLVNMVSRKSAVILDPFLGSGTTGVACINTNRNFIGIEKEINYFEIAKKRIHEAECEKAEVLI